MNKKRKYRFAAPIGGGFIILAVIGFLFVAVSGILLTVNMLDNTKEKSKFEKIIYPVLMFDPPPFDNPLNGEPVMLLQAALWSTLLGGKRDSYSYDDANRLIVPASDIDVASAKLFGTEVKLEHQSFGDFETFYTYEQATKTYHVPIVGIIGSYTPKIEKIEKNGDVYSLTVGYIPPSNAWTINLSGEETEPEPDKRMIYELQEQKNGEYCLIAIKDPPYQLQIAGVEAAKDTGNTNSTTVDPLDDIAEEVIGDTVLKAELITPVK